MCAFILPHVLSYALFNWKNKVLIDWLIAFPRTTMVPTAYTRMQFLNAVSHSVGAHGDALCEVDNPSESDDETDGDAAASEPQELPPAAQSDDHAQLCDVCLIQSRESRLVLFPCGRCRFCESCANEVQRIARGCPLCRTPIDMILRLCWINSVLTWDTVLTISG